MREKDDEFRPARTRIKLTTGEVIQILRQKKEWTQEELARRSGISAANISLLEHDRVAIGKKRAEHLAKAFGIHPAIIMFPKCEYPEIERAA